jgi:hypothetical protein
MAAIGVVPGMDWGMQTYAQTLAGDKDRPQCVSGFSLWDAEGHSVELQFP